MAKRARMVKGLQACVQESMDAASKNDLATVMTMLEEDPSLCKVVAQLLRDGSIQKALQHGLQPLNGVQPVNCRPLVPSTCKKWKHIKGRVAMSVLQELLGKQTFSNFTQACLPWFAEGHDVDAMVFALMMCALNVGSADDLPIAFADWRMQHTFLPLCQARYTQIGKRLTGLSLENFESCERFSQFYTLTEDLAHFQCRFCKVPEARFSLEATLAEGCYTLNNIFEATASVQKRGLTIKFLELLGDEAAHIDMPTGDWDLPGFIRSPAASQQAPAATPEAAAALEDSPKGAAPSQQASCATDGRGTAAVMQTPEKGRRCPQGDGQVHGAVPPDSK